MKYKSNLGEYCLFIMFFLSQLPQYLLQGILILHMIHFEKTFSIFFILLGLGLYYHLHYLNVNLTMIVKKIVKKYHF